MNIWIKKALVSLILLSGFSGEAAVWTEVNQWNEQWEQKYSSWIETEFNEDIFMTGKYKGIPNDCADAVYFGRLIFSYENKLPFVIIDPTGGKNKITHKMSRWDEKSELNRVREFMNFISWSVSTRTFSNDSYPVKINRTYVRPGAIWVRPSRETNLWNGIMATLTGKSKITDPGHAETVTKISDSGSVLLVGSTTPRAVRRLTLTSSFLIMPENSNVGLRQWILPEQYGQSKSSLPGYSEEQFKMGRSVISNSAASGVMGGSSSVQQEGARTFQAWRAEITKALSLRAETHQEALDRHAGDLCSLVHSRAENVRHALEAKEKKGRGCMNADEYDAYSTPTRDKRISATLKDLSKMASSGGFSMSGKIKSSEISAALKKCATIEIAPGQNMTLQEYMLNVASGQFSSNPNDSLKARWGFEASRNQCPTF